MVDDNIDYHLQQALEHEALNQSVAIVSQDQRLQKEISKKWGFFIGEFFGAVREKGKANRINLLKWFSVPYFENDTIQADVPLRVPFEEESLKHRPFLKTIRRLRGGYHKVFRLLVYFRDL